MTSNDAKPLLFISHRHVDSKIANVLRTFITSRGLGEISVFQSSSINHALEIGKNINQQLMDKLYKATVVLLLHTATDQDWSYCMWECGVATDPVSPDTRIVVFECAENPPAVFADQVRVNARIEEDLQRFVKDFLTDPGFFPRYGQAIAPDLEPDSEAIHDAAEDLYEKLIEVLPPLNEEPATEWPAWPFLQLELGLQQADLINEAKPDKRSQLAKEIIQQECVIIGGDSEAQRLFGMAGFPKCMKLQALVDMWKENNFESQSKWVEALCYQIMQGARWKFPDLKWELMQGVDHNWYAPVLNRVRRIPNQNCMQFDIYFYKFDINPDRASVQVGIPQ